MTASVESLPLWIDKVDGGLQIDTSFRLDRSTALADIRDMAGATQCGEEALGNNWLALQVQLGPFDSLFAILRLLFEGSSLREIHIVLRERSETSSWSDWSIEAEVSRKVLHDAWLLDRLGPGPYSFGWGEVLSVHDERGGFSEVIIRFA
jgi:hypothetical protein